jgi:predicted transcriptional regulator
MEMPMADTDLDFDAPSDESLDAEAEADFAAGRVIPHERVREWLLKLAKGESVPPPEV